VSISPERFLNAIFPSDIPAGMVALWTLADKRSRWYDVTQLDELAAEATRAAERSDAYYTTAAHDIETARREKAKREKLTMLPPAEQTRGCIASAAGIGALFGDIDTRGGVHRTAPEKLPTREEALAFIEALPLRPSMLVWSGGGFQPHWLLREWWAFQSEEERKAANGLLHGWNSYLRERARDAGGWEGDDVGDLARVLRIPGTLNRKNGHPARVVVEVFDETLRYNPSDFLEFAHIEPDTTCSAADERELLPDEARRHVHELLARASEKLKNGVFKKRHEGLLYVAGQARSNRVPREILDEYAPITKAILEPLGSSSSAFDLKRVRGVFSWAYTRMKLGEPWESVKTILEEQSRTSTWIGVYDVAGILARADTSGPRFLTGIGALDDGLAPKTNPSKKGLPLGRAVVFCGAPWQGKSVLIDQCARECAHQGLRVVLLVNDEPREDAAERIGQGLGFRHAELNAEYPATLERLRDKAADLDLHILPDEEEERPQPTIEDAAAFLRRKPNALGHVLALDSLHRVRSSTERDGDDSRAQIEKRMAVIRNLRRDGILVLLTAEVNRASYASKDVTKRQSPLASGAESRSIEYGSDVLLFLSAGDGGRVRAELVKNRVGRQRVAFSMRLDPGAARFVGVAEDDIRAEEKAAHAVALTAIEDRIIGVLRAAGGNGLSGRTIEAEHLGPKDDVREALATAASTGRVLKRPRAQQGGGFLYFLPSSPGAES
jgi:KaiC/GvpD/RAD55 family RecA-like ATPase